MGILKTILAALIISCTQAFASYDHYFTWNQKPNEADLKQCVAEMNALINARKDMLVSPDLEGSVPGSLKLESLKVDFNGVGNDAHEPFVFPGTNGFNFCTTDGKPYDEVVTACLIVARDHFSPKVLSINSDGSWDDWEKGAKLYTSVFHRPAKSPINDVWNREDSGGLLIVVLVFVSLPVVLFFWLKKKWS